MSFNPSAPFPQSWAGYCPICRDATTFTTDGVWLRDQLLCQRCGSIPRERALMSVIEEVFPNWRSLSIHESSPAARGVSPLLAAECRDYVASQYDPALGFGLIHPQLGYRSETLEEQTFSSERFDLVITQDVFEHLLAPDRAIREIARTLRPGGAHIMTVPIVNKGAPSSRRAVMLDGQMHYLADKQYHGNPVDPEGGALVTIDWGYDIANYLSAHSGMPTSIIMIDDIERGIRAEYIDVVISRKMPVPAL